MYRSFLQGKPGCCAELGLKHITSLQNPAACLRAVEGAGPYE